MAAKKSSGGKKAAKAEKPVKTMGKRPGRAKKAKASTDPPKKRGPKPKVKPEGEAPKKRGPKPKALTPEQIAAVPEALHAAAELGDADAIEHRTRILKAYDALKRAEARKAEVTKECKDRTNQERETFKSTIEAPVQDKAPKETLVEWIRRTQAAWQEVSETDLLNKEEKKNASKAFRAVRKIFDDTITNVSQLALPFGEVTEELPAPVAASVRGGNAEPDGMPFPADSEDEDENGVSGEEFEDDSRDDDPNETSGDDEDDEVEEDEAKDSELDFED